MFSRHWFLDRCGAWRAELGTATWHTWTSSTNHTLFLKPGGDFSSAPDYYVSFASSSPEDYYRTAAFSGASASYVYPLLSSPCPLDIF
ncbi:unnamed protein product [Gadus morhua 'NCC']